MGHTEFKLCLEILALGITVTEKTDFFVSVDYSGHVNLMTVRILVGQERELYHNMQKHIGKSYQDEDSLLVMREYLLSLLVAIDKV